MNIVPEKNLITTDQMGRHVACPSFPQRIISLVPSQTELLFDLGLGDRVVGITKFCIHPTHWFRSKTRVGGTKSLHLERIVSLNPDLIIGNKEENEQTQIEWLAERYPVWMSNIHTLDHAIQMIEKIGVLTNAEAHAAELAKTILSNFTILESAHNTLGASPRAAYLIWRVPWMAAGSNTFIHEMLIKGGFENIFSNRERYPEITLAELAALNPEFVMLSSEPYPFSEKHIAEISTFCPNAKILLVDGELFSWYGSRLLKTPHYLMELHAQYRGAKYGHPSD